MSLNLFHQKAIEPPTRFEHLMIFLTDSQCLQCDTTSTLNILKACHLVKLLCLDITYFIAVMHQRFTHLYPEFPKMCNALFAIIEYQQDFIYHMWRLSFAGRLCVKMWWWWGRYTAQRPHIGQFPVSPGAPARRQKVRTDATYQAQCVLSAKH